MNALSAWLRLFIVVPLLTALPALAANLVSVEWLQKNLGSDSLQRWLDAELAGRFPGQFSVARHASARTFRGVNASRCPAS